MAQPEDDVSPDFLGIGPQDIEDESPDFLGIGYVDDESPDFLGIGGESVAVAVAPSEQVVPLEVMKL